VSSHPTSTQVQYLASGDKQYKMKVEETFEDRAFRLLYGSETSANANSTLKNIMIPVVAFDGEGADRVLRCMFPLEGRDLHIPSEADIAYRSTYDGLQYEAEGRLDVESDYRLSEEYMGMGDREHIVSIEDVMRLDQMRLGYDEENDIKLHARTQKRGPEKKSEDESSRVTHGVKVSRDEEASADEEDGPDEAEDILQPIIGSIITPTHSMSEEEEFRADLIRQNKLRVDLLRQNEFRADDLMRQDSGDSEVSSVFSTASTVTSTPKMMVLKARKRRIERFLSEQSFDSSQSFRNIMNAILPASVTTSAC